jgi:hypothetical protein
MRGGRWTLAAPADAIHGAAHLYRPEPEARPRREPCCHLSACGLARPARTGRRFRCKARDGEGRALRRSRYRAPQARTPPRPETIRGREQLSVGDRRRPLSEAPRRRGSFRPGWSCVAASLWRAARGVGDGREVRRFIVVVHARRTAPRPRASAARAYKTTAAAVRAVTPLAVFMARDDAAFLMDVRPGAVRMAQAMSRC